ncbi:unnamed protein product [Mycena citricolor]|uniref:RING-type E3 ubiquitin transferase n=1 Tax=Mycena citricolor TaxID=2018698 RepID=A0AAD2HFL6_9AGAR|nr:unnamed protein product [Mycena citricolor]
MENPNPTREDQEPEAANGQRRNSVPHFIFISFMLFLLTNHNGDEFLAKHQYQDALQTLEHQVHSFLGNYSAWMNGTASNFSLPEQSPAIPALLSYFNLSNAALDITHSSYYSNSTGTFHGDVSFYNITPPYLNATAPDVLTPLATQYMGATNMSEVALKLGNWNFSASDKVAISLAEKAQLSGTALIHGKLELTDSINERDLRLEFEGIHYPENGTMYAIAEGIGQHVDIRYLPSIVPASSRNHTAHVVEPELASRVAKLRNLIDAGVIEPEAAADDSAKTECSFSLYLSLDPVKVPERLLRELEAETQHPTGAWTVTPPAMTLRGLLLSRDCGIVYQFHKTDGVGLHSLFRKLTTCGRRNHCDHISGHARPVVPSNATQPDSLGDLASFVLDISSPSNCRFAFFRWAYRFCAGSFRDTFVVIDRPRFSGLCFVCPRSMLIIFEQFAMLIQQFQAPENAPAPVPVVDSPAPEIGSPQPPVSPPAMQPVAPPAQPSFLAFLIHHLRTDPQLRLWILLFAFLTLIVHTILSATMSMIFVVVSYSSLWLPQIVRSVQRGRSSGLANEYLIGTTVCRLYMLLYFLLCPKNVLDIEPRPWVIILVLLICTQMLVVMLQDTGLGPTFFLPRSYGVVQRYDYHPVFPNPDEESAQSSLGDCSICMDAIMVERGRSLDQDKSGSIMSAVQIGVENVSARKNYSLAPCHHLFHTDCLERWLAIKNICPQCRRPLPPL